MPLPWEPTGSYALGAIWLEAATTGDDRSASAPPCCVAARRASRPCSAIRTSWPGPRRPSSLGSGSAGGDRGTAAPDRRVLRVGVESPPTQTQQGNRVGFLRRRKSEPEPDIQAPTAAFAAVGAASTRWRWPTWRAAATSFAHPGPEVCDRCRGSWNRWPWMASKWCRHCRSSCLSRTGDRAPLGPRAVDRGPPPGQPRDAPRPVRARADRGGGHDHRHTGLRLLLGETDTSGYPTFDAITGGLPATSTT